MGSEYHSHRLVLSLYPGSVTFSFFFLFIISFFANELFMKSIYRPVACNELNMIQIENVSVCVQLYVCVFVCECVGTSFRECVCALVNACQFVCMCACVCTSVSVCTRKCAFVRICVSACVGACM